MVKKRSAGALFLLAVTVVASPRPMSSRGALNVSDPGSPGPYAIAHTSFLLVDTSRNTTSAFGGRPIPVNVWYPADASAIADDTPRASYPLDPPYNRWPAATSAEWEQFGMPRAYENVAVSPDRPFPLVLLSHGWGGRYYGLFSYAVRLASHGFVVAVAQHFRDGSFQWDPRDPLDVALFNRPRDLSFMLDGILARNADASSVLFNSVRPEMVAAAGHSLGGYAAMALAGGDDEVCGTLEDPLPVACASVGTTLPDPRIKAIVPFDGSGWALHFSELARITVPSMGIGRPYETAEIQGTDQARQHAAIAGRPNYRVDIRNALHPSFNNNCTLVRVVYAKGLSSLSTLMNTLNAPQCTTAIDQREANRLAAKYAIAFLKTHLAGETGYQPILTPGWALTMEKDVEFFVSEPAHAAPDEEFGMFRFFPHQPGSHTERADKEPVNAVIADPIER